MGKFYDCIPDELVPWIQKQEMFFVASAPLSGSGHVNLSPKGLRGTLHIESKTRVWYEDLSGSGVETISHLRENGRITIMFCAFEGPPRIMRLFGTGTVYEYGTKEYFALIPPEKRLPGSRAAIVVDVHKANTSCGFAVPLYSFKSERSTLITFANQQEKRDQDFAAGTSTDPTDEVEFNGVLQACPEWSMRWMWATLNQRSIDGLVGLRQAHISDVVPKMGSLAKGVGRVATKEPSNDGTVVILGRRIPKETVMALLVPASREEVVRLVLAMCVGVGIAAVYTQIFQLAQATWKIPVLLFQWSTALH